MADGRIMRIGRKGVSYQDLYKKSQTSLEKLLYGNGEDGFLFYPPSVLSKMMTTIPGGTPVAANNDPIGLWLDSHSWGGLTLDAVLASVTEALTNSTFATAVFGWTNLSNSSVAWSAPNEAIVTISGTGGGIISSAGTSITVGKLFQYKVRVKAGTYVGGLSAIVGGVTVFTFTPTTEYVEYVGYIYATTSNPAVRIARLSAATGTFYVSEISLKEVPGNAGSNATGVQRPVWLANSGKPSVSWDGSDDSLLTQYPGGSAITLAIAFNASTTGALIAGGSGAANQRCTLQLDTSGRLAGGWGTQAFGVIVAGDDLRNQNHVGVLSADASTVELWLDNVKIYDAAASGTASGSTYGIAVGALNNAGIIGSRPVMTARAALARSVKSTPAEIASINSAFQALF